MEEGRKNLQLAKNTTERTGVRTREAGMLKHWEKRQENLKLAEANFYYNTEYPWPTVAEVTNWDFISNIQLADMLYLAHTVLHCTFFKHFLTWLQDF